MLPEFVARTGGSRWQSALPTGGSKWVSALLTGGSTQTSVGVWGSVKRMRNLLQPGASRQRRPVISRKLLEIRRIREVQFMLPEFVARTRGSKWNRALPGLPGLPGT